VEYKRLTLFAGHYGSGKTNIAVNYAVHMKRQGKEVVIADLDIVNPYFRTKDSAKELEGEGIRLISSEYANSNVDLPALPSQLYELVENKQSNAVLDIGGDDRGAFALGRYTPAILKENDYEMLFVINRHRPLTSDAQSTVEIMREIEAASGIPFTAIVNNSNIGPETTSDVVRSSYEYANEVSSLTGLPIKFTSVASFVDTSELDGELLLLDLQKKII
jgi:MinD-like ATPase involved in chromosome partitioning or flagellar assembly